MGLIALILFVLLLIFFIKWLKQKLYLRRLGNYFELMYSFDSKYNLIFAVISPVRAVRPRSEYSGFTAKVYFNDLEAAEAERQRIIEYSTTHDPIIETKKTL